MLEKRTLMLTDNINRAALTAFFKITNLWGLNEEQEQTILGRPSKTIFLEWKRDKQGYLSQDTLEHISYILGIYHALQILLPSEKSANEWLKKPNLAPLFNGRSALNKMLAGTVKDLSEIRRYLEAEKN